MKEPAHTAHWDVRSPTEGTRVVFDPVAPSAAPSEQDSIGSETGDDCVVVLAHGAGGRHDHPAMRDLAELVRTAGAGVARFDFFYRAAGRGRPDPMPVLMDCYQRVVQSVVERLSPSRLVIGGHSMGGRTASMLAAEGLPCSGLLLLAYPLHPPGEPQRMRDAHLPRITVPVLCLNGTRDKLCQQDLMQQVMSRLGPNWTMHWLEGADHGYRVLKRSGRTNDDVREEMRQAIQDWIGTRIGR